MMGRNAPFGKKKSLKCWLLQTLVQLKLRAPAGVKPHPGILLSWHPTSQRLTYKLYLPMPLCPTPPLWVLGTT